MKTSSQSYPLFSSNPLSKLKSSQAPLFENLVGGSTPQQEEGWGCSHFNFVDTSNPEHIPMSKTYSRSFLLNNIEFKRQHKFLCRKQMTKSFYENSSQEKCPKSCMVSSVLAPNIVGNKANGRISKQTQKNKCAKFSEKGIFLTP